MKYNKGGIFITNEILKNLTLKNDFLFCHTFADKHIVKLLIEAVLGVSVSNIEYVKDQESHEDNPEKKGVRFDCFAIDIDGNAYDLEMQNRNTGDIPNRAKVYLGHMYKNMLEKGIKSYNIPNACVIFVCNFDLYGLGKMLYIQESIIRGTNIKPFSHPDTFYINLKYTDVDDANKYPELKNLVDLINQAPDFVPQCELTKETIRRIEKLKNSPTEEEYLMLNLFRDEDLRNEGRRETKIQNAKEFLKNGVSTEIIRKSIHLTDEEWKEVCRKC